MSRFQVSRSASSLVLLAGLLGATACSSSDDKGATAPLSQKQRVVQAMHDSLLSDINALHSAAQAIQQAVPSGDRGWDATADADALGATKSAWQAARTAYEHTEGALAPLFPMIDYSIDARYDDFLANLPDGDSDLFDDQGVTGMHALERILWSDAIPAHVTTFEQTLPGYQRAMFPGDAAASASLKSKLCQKLIDDTGTLQSQWAPAIIDLNGAFDGLISLMNEQHEKVNKASTGEEESRYSQRTMADIRDNLDGTRAIYSLFHDWLVSQKNASDPSLDGPTIDAAIAGGFDKLDTLYSQTSGDAIPAPPDTWSSEQPSAQDLTTPFGVLFKGVNAAVDPADPTSIVSNMNRAAQVLGLTQFAPEP